MFSAILLALALLQGTEMPAPSNTTYLTAATITSLPASVTQNVRDGGTTYSVYYKYTADATGIIGLFGFGDVSIYQPLTYVYEDDPLSPGSFTTIINGAGNVPCQFKARFGYTYYFFFQTNSSSATPAVLLIEIERAPNGIVPAGSLFIPDDTIGYPAAILSAVDGDDNHVLGFSFGFPAGENGDVLRSGGQILVDDISPSPDNLKLYDSGLNLLQTIAYTPGGATDLIRASQGLGKFIAGAVASPVATAQIVNADGTLGTLYTLPQAGMTAVALSNDGAILYVAGQATFSTAVKRYQTGSSTFGTDLAAAVGGYPATSILVLGDNTIVVLYQKSTAPQDVLAKRFQDDGTLLNTYTIASAGNSTAPRMTSATDDPASFWVWAHIDVGGNSTSRFQNIRATDGVVLKEIDSIDFEEGIAQSVMSATPPARFGTSFSCPMIVLAAAVVPPVITNTVPTCCDTPTGPGDTGTNPDPIGVLPPWMASCTDGGVVDSVADLADGEIW